MATPSPAARFPGLTARCSLRGSAVTSRSDPLDFIAELTQHVPEPRKHLIRYFGWYANKTRGQAHLRQRPRVRRRPRTRRARLVGRLTQMTGLGLPQGSEPARLVRGGFV
ncbi:MAG: transposase, partial [Planctomycetota bacterium]